MVHHSLKIEQLRHKLATAVSRRWFMQECGLGMGALALRSLLGDESLQAADSI